MKSIIDGRFDATLPMCTSSLLHQIPGLKMVMWATEPMGTAVKFLILSHSKMPIRVPKKFTTPQRGIWEWDALTVYNGWEKKALRFKPVDKDDNEVMEDGEQKFRMGIETPDSANLDLYLTFTTKTDADKLEVAHTKLWNDLDKPTTNIFLLYWRGLLACQTAKSFEHMWSQSSKASKNTFELTEILNAVKDFKDKDLKGWKDKGARLNIFVGEPLSEPNEITLGAVMERRTLQAKHLVAMLIYIENFPKPSEVNPLLPLVWWWAKGWTKETDNMFFTLPTVKIKDRTKKPTQNTRHLEGASPTTPNTLVIAKPPAVANASAYCEITLSKGLPQIDGCEYLRTSRAPWVLSTFFGMILTFFTSLAASSNPSLATSVGLLFLKPYSNDYNFLDAGCPPSWNGRRQIRWGNGANSNMCGIFNGPTRLRAGNTGNSLCRALILTAVAWLTWGWQSELRRALSFGEIHGAPGWVMWVALAIEISLVICGPGAIYIIYPRWSHTWLATVIFIFTLYVTTVSGLMLRYLLTGKGLKTLFFVSEGYMLVAAPLCTFTHVGSGVKNGSIQVVCMFFWLHLVATSCFR